MGGFHPSISWCLDWTDFELNSRAHHQRPNAIQSIFVFGGEKRTNSTQRQLAINWEQSMWLSVSHWCLLLPLLAAKDDCECECEPYIIRWTSHWLGLVFIACIVRASHAWLTLFSTLVRGMCFQRKLPSHSYGTIYVWTLCARCTGFVESTAFAPKKGERDKITMWQRCWRTRQKLHYGNGGTTALYDLRDRPIKIIKYFFYYNNNSFLSSSVPCDVMRCSRGCPELRLLGVLHHVDFKWQSVFSFGFGRNCATNLMLFPSFRCLGSTSEFGWRSFKI